jgi:hypothetical protein
MVRTEAVWEEKNYPVLVPAFLRIKNPPKRVWKQQHPGILRVRHHEHALALEGPGAGRSTLQGCSQGMRIGPIRTVVDLSPRSVQCQFRGAPIAKGDNVCVRASEGYHVLGRPGAANVNRRALGSISWVFKDDGYSGL